MSGRAGVVVIEQDGFLTLTGLLLAVAKAVGTDRDPMQGPCIPEVTYDDEDVAMSLFFGIKDVFWNADGGVTIRVEPR